MAKIDITRTHSLGVDEVKTKINNLASEIEQKYSLKSSWVDDTSLSITGTGIKKGSISFTGKEVKVDIDLSFAVSMLKGKIEQKINDVLDKELK
ncbi:polyhydroxyalkanoic acid system family protein [Myxococcota bacterium]|nr:polyhydroxyalkanoic acid system family protein [Myxococcota bacterium]MBU1533689.1 polyhydroxyalkanoic acid system family protein [Myxococcota bacterium]